MPLPPCGQNGNVIHYASFKTSRGSCASESANRVERHGGIGEIRDVSERIGKTVPGKLPVVLKQVGGRFLLRGIAPLDALDQKEQGT